MAVAKAMFGAGCFWGVEVAFSKAAGVISTKVGYSGGNCENPSYEQVCTGATGHAEVVLVEYDESKTSYNELLDLFFKIHDPTTLNRQGPDVGTQYRSAIYYFSEDQKALASERIKPPIVTEVAEATEFYPAEDYHQKYLEKRGKASCGI